MKQLALIIFFAIFLSGCYDEKKQYEQAVLEQISADQDIKDYQIDSEEMMRCVVDTSSKNMVGIFSLDPRRKPIYAGYAQLITLKTAKDPQKKLKELQDVFGSAQEVSNAHRNYSESVFTCVQTLVLEQDPEFGETS